jgi:hypothetical protein
MKSTLQYNRPIGYITRRGLISGRRGTGRGQCPAIERGRSRLMTVGCEPRITAVVAEGTLGSYVNNIARTPVHPVLRRAAVIHPAPVAVGVSQ